MMWGCVGHFSEKWFYAFDLCLLMWFAARTRSHDAECGHRFAKWWILESTRAKSGKTIVALTPWRGKSSRRSESEQVQTCPVDVQESRVCPVTVQEDKSFLKRSSFVIFLEENVFVSFQNLDIFQHSFSIATAWFGKIPMSFSGCPRDLSTWWLLRWFFVVWFRCKRFYCA